MNRTLLALLLGACLLIVLIVRIKSDVHGSVPSLAREPVGTSPAAGVMVSTSSAEVTRAPVGSHSPEKRQVPRVDIMGHVDMCLPWIDRALLARISASRTPEECRALLAEVRPSPAANALVRLGGSDGSQDTVTSAAGDFVFCNMQRGEYALAAELLLADPETGGLLKLSAATRVALAEEGVVARVTLTLRDSLVAIRGRVVDSFGRPVAGVNVKGSAVSGAGHDMPDDDVPFCLEATTDVNGEYRLYGFAPPPLFNAACVMLGLMKESGLDGVDVRVVGAQPTEGGKVWVPLMTEALSHAAAPLAEALSELPPSVKFPVARPGTDSSKVKAYSSQSNDIQGVDLVADPRR